MFLNKRFNIVSKCKALKTDRLLIKPINSIKFVLIKCPNSLVENFFIKFNFKNNELSFIFKVNFIDLILIFQLAFFYFSSMRKKFTNKTIPNRDLTLNDCYSQKHILSLFEYNFNTLFLCLNSIEIDQELLEKYESDYVNISLTPKVQKRKLNDEDFKPDIMDLIQDFDSFSIPGTQAFNFSPVSAQSQPYISNKKVKFDLDNDSPFKAPFSLPIIESTQAFHFVPPTQYFYVEEDSSSQFESSFIQSKQCEFKSLDLEYTETPTVIFSSEVIQSSTPISESRIMQIEEVETDLENHSDLFSPVIKPTLEKRLNEEPPIKLEKFINFMPNYNSVNPINQNLIHPTQSRSQVVGKTVLKPISNGNDENSNLAHTQTTQTPTSSKSLKRRSFMTIGLSKKQRIKNHLHKI